MTSTTTSTTIVFLDMVSFLRCSVLRYHPLSYPFAARTATAIIALAAACPIKIAAFGLLCGGGPCPFVSFCVPPSKGRSVRFGIAGAVAARERAVGRIDAHPPHLTGELA